MIDPLHVLFAASADAESSRRAADALRRVGYDVRPRVVISPEAWGVALTERPWDVVVVLAEGLPFAPLDAVAWARRKQATTPVLVAGAPPTEAVALLHAGATDVLEPGREDRLGPAVARALRDQPAPPDDPLRALAAQAAIGFYRSTPDGRILYANPALARILGCRGVDELLGKDVGRDLRYPRAAFEAAIAREGHVEGLELSWTRADGRRIHTREHARVVRDAAGHILYFEGTIEDVTAEREALLRERRHAAQLEALAHYSRAADEAEDLDALYRATAEAARRVTGAAGVVLLETGHAPPRGVARSGDVPDEAVAACQALFARPVAAAEEPHRLTCPELAAAGFPGVEVFPLRHRGRTVGLLVVLLDEGVVLGEQEVRMGAALAGHAAVALARHEAEAAVRASESTLRSIARATGHVLYRRRCGESGFDYVTDSVQALTGYTAAELEALGGLERLAVDAPPPEPDGDPHAAGCVLRRIRTRAGALRWVEDRTHPWIVAAKPVGVVGVLEDVTEREERAAQERARAAAVLAHQRALLDLSAREAEGHLPLEEVARTAAQATGTARAGVWMLGGRPDPRTGDRTLYCRALYRRDTDTPATEPAAMPADLGAGRAALRRHHVFANEDVWATGTGSAALDAYYAEHDIQAVLVATVRQHGEVVGFVALEHTGSPRTWTAEEREFVRALADLVALAEERARRRRAEEALRASEARHRAISEMISDYAFAVRFGPDGTERVEWVTHAFERITGYAPSAFTSGEDMLERLVHPEDVALVRAWNERIDAGEPVELTFRIVRRDGAVRWVHHRARPLLGADGRVEAVLATGQDVSERVHFEAELQAERDRAEAARARAEQTAREKGDLLAAMSHEIRTPLTGIIGFAEVLAAEVGAEHREFAELIAESGRRLLETLNSVLDLARLESRRFELEPVALDAAEEVRQVAGLLRPLAEAKGVALHVGAEEPVPARLDRAAFGRILVNLLGNAVKFTDEGHVRVALGVDGDTLRLTVADTGVGIDAAFLPHLFEEFRQEGGDPERREGGSGLGLAITKRLVGLMGGTIDVVSRKGEGTTFTVCLPYHRPSEEVGAAAASRPVADVEPDEPSPLAALFEPDEEPPPTLTLPPERPATYTVRPVLEEAVETGRNGRDAVAAETGGDGRADPPGKPWRGDGGGAAPGLAPTLHVLVVEDNPEARRLFERILSRCARVDAVADARTALEHMARRVYDALVLDIHLGGRQTGADVLRVARTLPGYATVPALAVTAYALPGDREELLRSGFNGYLSKPFTARTLLEALRAAGVPVPAGS